MKFDSGMHSHSGPATLQELQGKDNELN